MQNTPADRAGLGRSGPPGRRQGLALTIATYVALVAFGAAQALIGTFFYGAGLVPVASILFDLAILATCVLGAWGLEQPSGGLAAAAGWFLVVLILASGTSGGSVLIAANTAGEWFLFGGAASAAIGVIAAFMIWTRSSLTRSRRLPAGR